MPILFQTTFSDQRYPTNNVNNPVGRVDVHGEGSDWFYDDYGQNFVPGIGGSGPDGVIGKAGNQFTSKFTSDGFLPNDRLWHPTGDSRIWTPANNPAGGGGKGFRTYRGNGGTGQNDGSHSFKITLPQLYSELWFRFYIRFENGFTWGPNGVAAPGYSKECRAAGANGFVYGIQGAGSWGVFTPPDHHIGNRSWEQTMGGLKGDGLWHCHEWHIKNGAAGIVEIWIDDVQVYSYSGNVPATDVEEVLCADNQNAVGDANGLSVDNGGTPTDWYTDYDDIAISDSGRIGPLVSVPAGQSMRMEYSGVHTVVCG